MGSIVVAVQVWATTRMLQSDWALELAKSTFQEILVPPGSTPAPPAGKPPESESQPVSDSESESDRESESDPRSHAELSTESRPRPEAEPDGQGDGPALSSGEDSLGTEASTDGNVGADPGRDGAEAVEDLMAPVDDAGDADAVDPGAEADL